MSQFSRTQFPNGGWQFYQPQTGWSNPMPMAYTFDRTVQEIIKHRLENGAITARHNLRTDFAGVAEELENYTRARIGMPLIGAQSAPKPNPQQPLPQVVVGAVEGLKRTAYGVAPLIEWLSSGGQAVATELSAKRAGICAGCPRNQPPDWTKFFTVKASEMIKAELERRADLKLSTPFDNKLGICTACLCPMQLKVHTPLDIILKHLKPEIRSDLDGRCWILHQDQ